MTWLQHIAIDRVPPQPWRNGGGSTRELLAWPTPADWALRISVATIGANGPFSAYPGIERWFAVVHGEGVALRWPQRRTLLTVESDPVRFEGASAPGCQLLDGPTQDLNLMVRHDAGTGAMLRATAEAWTSTAALRAVFTMGPATLQIDDAEPNQLPAGTLAWHEHAAQQRWRLRGGAAPCAWWLQLKAFPT